MIFFAKKSFQRCIWRRDGSRVRGKNEVEGLRVIPGKVRVSLDEEVVEFGKCSV